MANIQPLSTTKGDSRRIFEKKIQWWLMSCQWSGLYLGNSSNDAIHTSKRRIWLKRVWKFIRCVVFIYLLTYTSFLAYRYHSKTLFTSSWIKSFNVLVWCSAVALWQLSVMVGFGRGNLYFWCHEVSMYCEDYGLNERFVVDLNKIPRNVIRNLVFNIIFTGLAVYIYDWILDVGEAVYPFPIEMRILNVFTFAVLGFLQNYTSSNLGPIVEICSNLVNYEMDRVNKDLAICCEERNVSKTLLSTVNVKDKNLDISIRLDKAMEQHSRICDLIGHFNKCICHYAAASFLLGLPMSCFALYIILTKVKDTVDGVMTSFTMVTSLIPILTNCIMGCYVNYKTHQALDFIWKMPNAKLKESTMRNLSQLTVRLTSTSIGYTVYGFFTFSMPAVLSIIGCILTYFIVVIQFKPLEQADCSSECNNTLPSWCVNNTTV